MVRPPWKGAQPPGAETWLGRQNEAKQPAITTPAEAMGVIASSLLAIHPPTEAGLLEAFGDSHGIRGRDALKDLQGGVGQKSFETGCR